MPTVWRWESALDGLGPYRWTPGRESVAFWTLRNTLDKFHENKDGKHPGPRVDGLKEELEEGWYFGCPDSDALKTWFVDIDDHLLRAAGMVIRVYEVPDERVSISTSGKQCAFDRGHAVLVRQM